MPQEPRHKPGGGRLAAERQLASAAPVRQFVGREEFVAPVQAALKEPPRAKPLVLVYHGGAGIGKSRLRRELVRQLARDPEVLTATLDFDVTGHRHPESALFFLRKTLGEAYEVRFPSFDLAYAVFWQKGHPETPLASGDMTGLARLSAEENRACTHSRSQDGGCTKEAATDSLLFQLLDESGKLPLIGLIPKVSALVGSRQNTVDREWWEQRGERELEDIPQMEPGEIVDRLPALWAADLKEFIVSRSSFIVDRRAVLFIDSYEKLWEIGGSRQETVDSRQKTDEWVRELVTELPEVLWVICGRQKLRWGEVEADWGKALSQHELGALPEKSARRFLESCDVTDGQLQDAIVKGSQGVPHYLNLAADAVQNAEGKVQDAEIRGANPEELVAEFTRQLDKPEIETLQVLSAARFWYYGLFEQLVAQYRTGYSPTGYDDLARFSFIREGAEPGTRTMHELMREALQESQPPELRRSVHLFLHEYYAKQLEGLEAKSITDQHRTGLVEAFYHARHAWSAEQLWSWLESASRVFREAHQPRLLSPLYREVVQALEAEPGTNHPDIATAVFRLADELRKMDDFDEAEALLRRALAIVETGHGPEHPFCPKILVVLANLLWARGRYEEAEVLSRRAVRRLETEPGKDGAGRTDALCSLAKVLTFQRKYDEAEDLLRRALAGCETELGPQHDVTTTVVSHLALLYFEQARYSEAEPLNRRALEIRRKSLGEKHPTVAGAMLSYAGVLLRLGRHVEAEPILQRALWIYEQTLGPEHNYTAMATNNLAALLFEGGRYAEAEALGRRALAVQVRKLGSNHVQTVRTADFLIMMLARQGKYAEAEPMALHAVEDREKQRGPDHPETAQALHRAGVVFSGQGRYAEAETFLRRGLEIRTKALGPENRLTLGSLHEMALLEERRGRYTEAESLYRDTLEKRTRVMGPDYPLVADTAHQLAGVCARDGRYEEAESLFRRALAIREKAFGPNHTFVAETLEGLAKVCEQTGRAAEAQGFAERAKAIRDKNVAAAQAQAPSLS